MELRHLKHLVALADEGRFVVAAERVHLSQAAFSRSIQALEQQLGLRLFDRGPQGAVLTPAGRTVATRARALLFDSRCLERDVALLREGTIGELSFGAGPVPAALLVPPLLARLNRESPTLVMRVRNGNFLSLSQMLHAEAIDFFLGDPRLAEHDERLELAPIAQVSATLYARAGHPLLRRRAAAGPDDLRRHGIAMMTTAAPLGALIARALGFSSRAEVPVRVECDDLASLARLAQDSDVLVGLPDALVATSAALRSLRPVRLALAGEPPCVDIHAAWLRGRTLSPAAQRAIALVRELAGPMAARWQGAGR